MLKNILYLICLFAAYKGFWSLNAAFLSLSLNSSSVVLVKYLTRLPLSIILLFVIYRILVYAKSRSIRAPESFGGVLIYAAIFATLPALIASYSMIYFLQGGSLGDSPFSYALLFGVTGALAVLPVLYCESKLLFSSMPAKKRVN